MVRSRKEFKLLAIDTLLIFLLGTFYPAAPARAGSPTIPGLRGGGIGPSVPAAQDLPVLRNAVQGVSSVERPQPNKLLVRQGQDKAIIDWDSFNIGRDAWTHFDQQGRTDWAALNRIYDQNPSLIFGRLTADGKVYLVNPNGVLFGPDSKVTAHSVVASALEMQQEEFLAGLLRFRAAEDGGAGGTVSNQGTIETDELGSVFLIGSNVENSGTIRSPLGQIGLAAGTDVEMSPDRTPNTRRTALVVKVKENPGRAANLREGQLSADTGLVGLYGREVRQEGAVRAVTAIKRSGTIELMASEKVVTGPQSVTSCPVSDSEEKVHESFSYLPGTVRIDGLDPSSPLTPSTPVKRIEHAGLIEAPSGTVTMRAEERVYLDRDSRIDVSGSWIDMPGDADWIELQLNSVELRDDYGQKEGLLRGKKILVHATAGSAIGDISGALSAEEKTALERSTKGGTVEIQAGRGDIVVREGGSIDFSGGGLRYGASAGKSTKVLSGQRIYDISEAPEWVAYDAILGDQEFRYDRHGIAEVFKGLFYGGASSLLDRLPGFVEGADAGMLKLIARRIVLDGDLLGSVVKGPFQTEKSEPTNKQGSPATRGRREPRGGRVEIGDPQDSAFPESIDRVVHEIVLADSVSPLPDGFTAADPMPEGYGAGQGGPLSTVLSASKLSSAGLDSLGLFTNTAFKTVAEAALALTPGGSLAVKARSIEHFGSIDVPAGSVRIETQDNVTSALVELGGVLNPLYVPVRERIDLAPGSRISAGGERVDNSTVGDGMGNVRQVGRRDAGSISIEEKNRNGEGVVVHRGAVLDVSGGYLVDGQGNVRGGDAGKLSLRGSALVLGGELKGHALAERDGGRISLHAEDVSVVPEAVVLSSGFGVDSDLPDLLKGKLLLAQYRLADTGFAHVALKSLNDLTVKEGVSFTPSDLRLAPPVPGREGIKNGIPLNQGQTPLAVTGGGGEPFVRARPELAGPSSLELEAGFAVRLDQEDNPLAKIRIDAGARIQAGPKGKIGFSAPGVEIAGTVETQAGEVRIQATQRKVVLENGASILARGFNRPDTAGRVQGMPLGSTAVSGGDVIFRAPAGDIVLESGSLVDVSGSDPTRGFLQNLDGRVSSFPVAGDPGSVAFEFLTDLTLEGTLEGHGKWEGLRGGDLSLKKLDLTDGLALDAAQIRSFAESGFDAVSFQSLKSLAFSGSMDVEVGRKLILDAPEIQGVGDDRIRLSAPWVEVRNTYWPSAGQAAGGNASLSLFAGFLDVQGSVSLSGFRQVRLASENDLTLTERLYVLPGGIRPVWRGDLTTEGDLTLQAARVYPTTLSDYTIRSPGKVRILPAGRATGPVYSAGGKLAIEAGGIEHHGTLAAPMGELVLRASGEAGRVFLGPGSVTSTTGEAPVAFGTLDEEYWIVPDKSTNLARPVETAPGKSVRISGAEVVVREGAAVESSGGGSVFGYQFLPGIEGSENPLGKRGRYVILPGVPARFPGEAVTLSGTAGLAAGTYSLLPDRFAFLPGAMVLEEVGSVAAVSPSLLSPEGYRIVAGYAMVSGTDLRSPVQKYYSLRPAEDVLKEGFFAFREIRAGDAGKVSMAGNTTILDGTVSGVALSGYRGGILELTGEEIVVGAGQQSLPKGFGYETPVPDDLRGKLRVGSETLAGRGIEELQIGDPENTRSITLEQGSRLQAPAVTLRASHSITLETGSAVEASGTEGRVGLLSPQGSVIVREGAHLGASGAVHIDTASIDLDGGLEVDAREMSFSGERIVFTPDAYAGEMPDGVHISQSLWEKFDSMESLRFEGRSELVFLGDVDFETGNELTLAAPRVTGFDPTGESSVALGAKRIRLLNRGPASGDGTLADTGRLSLNAEEIFVGRGKVMLDGFQQVSLSGQAGVTFQGSGSLVLNGNLDISAPRISGRYDAEETYQPLDFQVDAQQGAIRLLGNGGTPRQDTSVGGSLSFSASRIEMGGPNPASPGLLLELPSGRLGLTALGSGAEGIVLNRGSQIVARSTEFAPAGVVTLRTDRGGIRIEEGARIDVSATGDADAGFVSLSSPEGELLLAGNLEGSVQRGKGGSVALDLAALSDFSDLNRRLSQGGFHGDWSLRVRGGDVALENTDHVRASRFRLAADRGNVAIRGTVDVSGPESGGEVEIWAGQDLALRSGSQVRAKGLESGARGGSVVLGSSQGRLELDAGAAVDVSGSSSSSGGRVLFVASRDGSSVRMHLAGTVSGASQVQAVANRVYEYSGDLTIATPEIQTWYDDTLRFLSEARFHPALEGVPSGVFSLLPGVEVRSRGNMALGSPWDLGFWRFGESPGMLALRSSGDLLLQADLQDASAVGPASWLFCLAAGADLDGADPLSVVRGRGDLVVADGSAVLTRQAPLCFAAGRDVWIGRASSERTQTVGAVPFSVATSGGRILGRVGRDLVLNGGALQSETGDIRIEVGRDLVLGTQQGALGTIRTLGRLRADIDPSTYSREPFWEYAGGGDISVRVDGNVNGLLNNNAWDTAYAYNYTDPDGIRRKGLSWGASYLSRNATQGLATLAGGDLTVIAGGDFAGQAGTFGSGDLRIWVGGDLDGRFLVRRGSGNLVAMGNIGSRISNMALEMFESGVDLSAQGRISLGTILNPTVARDGFTSQWDLTYSRDSRVSLFARTGDVTLSGINTFYFQGGGLRSRVLPPNVEIVAGGDIRFSNEYFMVPPSPKGNVRLIAGRDIDGQYFEGVGANAREKRSGIYLSDMDPAEVYGQQGTEIDANDLKDVYRHAASPVHLGDEVPIEIRAGRDIRNLEFSFSKHSRITAGRDIRDISYFGQNVSPQDVTTIRAGRYLRFRSSPDVIFKMGLEHAGPGFLLVQAANMIDLGTSEGISSIGNQFNPALGPSGSSVAVIAGFGLETGEEALRGFFEALREAGTDYSELLAEGNALEAEAKVEEARTTVIVPFLGQAATGGGDLNMINSQINTSAGKDDLFLIVAGDLNVGRSTFFTDESQRKNTGIYTASGGGIHIYAGGDVNVNESRVMTFRGGDIVVWSDRGNINAGRGSKTAINTEPPKPVLIQGVYVIQFNPPAVGSGIRTLTYDPDGIEGPQEAPVAGDVNLFAPEGEIDAGEAGISGTNVILGATTIVNAQNIQFTQGSVGVPVASQAGGGLGALAGTGALSETSRMAQESSSLGSAQDRLDADKDKLAESFKPKWLDVKVIDFGDKGSEGASEPGEGKSEEDEKDRKS